MSAPMINIHGAKPIDDPAYRYKMPKILTKIEGSGNGIKTVMANLGEVAEALGREVEHVNKYFGHEFGAQSKYLADLEKAIVNGAHTQVDVQNILFKFIDHFVLCPKCKYPETALSFNLKSDQIFHKCAACGEKSAVDMSHKLCTVMMKDAKQKKKSKKSKKDKKVKKDKKDKKDRKEKKDEKRHKKRRKDKTEEVEEVPEIETKIEEIDISAPAVIDACIAKLSDFLKVGAPAIALVEEALSFCLLQGMPKCEVVPALYSAFSNNFSVDESVIDLLKVKTALGCIELVLEEGDEAILAEHCLAVVQTLARHACVKPEFIKFALPLFKLAYDMDVLDEDVFVEWFEGDSAVQGVDAAVVGEMKKNLTPFVEWLQEEDEEESS